MGNLALQHPYKQQSINDFFRERLQHWDDDHTWMHRETFDEHMTRYRGELNAVVQRDYYLALTTIMHMDRSNAFPSKIWLDQTIAGYVRTKERMPKELLLLHSAARDRDRFLQGKYIARGRRSTAARHE
jgi:hypothetical protein